MVNQRGPAKRERLGRAASDRNGNGQVGNGQVANGQVGNGQSANGSGRAARIATRDAPASHNNRADGQTGVLAFVSRPSFIE